MDFSTVMKPAARTGGAGGDDAATGQLPGAIMPQTMSVTGGGSREIIDSMNQTYFGNRPSGIGEAWRTLWEHYMGNKSTQTNSTSPSVPPTIVVEVPPVEFCDP